MTEYRHTYYLHALKSDIRKLKVHYILAPNHMLSCLLKQMSEAHGFVSVGMELQKEREGERGGIKRGGEKKKRDCLCGWVGVGIFQAVSKIGDKFWHGDATNGTAFF